MSKVIEITDLSFNQEVEKSELPVLVDFYADWCGPCKMQHPVLEQTAEAFSGKIKIGKLNVDTAQQKASEFGVRSIPTLMVFKNGKAVERVMGFHPADRLSAILKKHM